MTFFSRVISWLSFLFFPPSCSSSSSSRRHRNVDIIFCLFYITSSSCSLLFHPNLLLFCNTFRCLLRPTRLDSFLVSLNHVVTIWCDVVYKQIIDDDIEATQNKRREKWFCVTKFEVVVVSVEFSVSTLGSFVDSARSQASSIIQSHWKYSETYEFWIYYIFFLDLLVTRTCSSHHDFCLQGCQFSWVFFWCLKRLQRGCVIFNEAWDRKFWLPHHTTHGYLRQSSSIIFFLWCCKTFSLLSIINMIVVSSSVALLPFNIHGETTILWCYIIVYFDSSFILFNARRALSSLVDRRKQQRDENKSKRFEIQVSISHSLISPLPNNRVLQVLDNHDSESPTM